MKHEAKKAKSHKKEMKHMDVKEDKKIIKEMVKPMAMKKSSRGR